MVSKAFFAGKAGLPSARLAAVIRVGLLALVLIVAPKLARSAEPALPAEHVYRSIETVLLPLSVDTVAIPPALGVHPGPGGGLTVVDDTIVIVDVKGAFFALEQDIVRALTLPSINNHAEDYDRFAPKPMRLGRFLVNNGFVVHDLKSRREPAGIRLFVSYERYLPELRTTALAVSAILLGKELLPLGEWQDVYEGPPLVAEWYSGVAGGGRMVVRGDDLYLTVGDYNQDNVFMSSQLEAQNPDSDFGKILKIDLRTNVKTRVSSGHRVPQGLTITAAGAIYATEHGPQGGDELNLIVAGKNYGWPIATYGTHYGTYGWPNSAAATATPFEPPVFAWVPSIGISNLIEASNFHPAWDGDLLVESLRAQVLHRLRRDREGRVIYSEPIPLGHRLRDIGALSDGTLVLWTDDAQLMFLRVDRAKLATNQR
jgi:hypothetical protein